MTNDKNRTVTHIDIEEAQPTADMPNENKTDLTDQEHATVTIDGREILTSDDNIDFEGELTPEQAKQFFEAFNAFYESNGEKVSKAAMSVISKTFNLKDSFNKLMDYYAADDLHVTIRKLREIGERLKASSSLIEEIMTLEPYIKEELQKPEYEGITFDDILDYTPGELLRLRQDPDTAVSRLLEAARFASLSDMSIVPYTATKMDMGTDKINLFAWDLKETNGQIKFNLARTDTADRATALFSLSFDDDPNIKISKELNHFDKRIVDVLGTAYNEGNTIISATGIYHAMGGTGKPSANMISRIDKSLTKLDMGKVYLDNTIEAELYDYERYKGEDRLIHIKRVTRIINNKVTESLIQILSEPVLLAFARQRNQLTTIPVEVLQSKVSKTDKHLRIEDYLLHRISRRKREINKLKEQQAKKYSQQRQKALKEKSELTILLTTFYTHTGIANKDATAKRRARETAEEYLQHYASEAGKQWITNYKITKDNIKITLPIK